MRPLEASSSSVKATRSHSKPLRAVLEATLVPQDRSKMPQDGSKSAPRGLQTARIALRTRKNSRKLRPEPLGPLEPLGEGSEASSSALEASWSALGAVLGPLRTVLRPPGALLEPSRGLERAQRGLQWLRDEKWLRVASRALRSGLEASEEASSGLKSARRSSATYPDSAGIKSSQLENAI